jgi:hypothetical protein
MFVLTCCSVSQLVIFYEKRGGKLSTYQVIQPVLTLGVEARLNLPLIATIWLAAMVSGKKSSSCLLRDYKLEVKGNGGEIVLCQ